MQSFFDAIPKDLEESAMLEGCTRFQARGHHPVNRRNDHHQRKHLRKQQQGRHHHLAAKLKLLPGGFTLSHFAKVLTDSDFPTFFINSLIVSFST
jgi:ABC-type glycerol-3-phosphate transport system permease component